MADITQTLKYVLLGEDKTASKAMAGVGKSASDAGAKLDGVRGRASSLRSTLGTIGAAAAAGAIMQFGKSVVDTSSRSQQSIGGVSAAFGKSAGEVEKSAKRAGDALGLSANSYRELATTLGAGLKNKGIEDYAAKSGDLIKIGADLAAQFGGSTTDAVDALASAMRGESDPIEKYGVSLSESAIKAELAAKGQDKLKGAALETAKTQARLRLITKQTADAQGAFGRESDTLAGKQARLSAKFENTKSALGDKLLPAMSALADAASVAVDWISQNTDLLVPLAIGFGVVAGAVLLMNLAMAANPVGGLIILLGLLVAALVHTYNESESFRNIVNGAFKAIGDAGRWLWNSALAPALRAIVNGFAWVTDGLAGMLEALGNVPGFGWAKTAAAAMRGTAADARKLAGEIRDIPDADPQIVARDKATATIRKIDREIKSLKGKVVEAKAKGDSAQVRTLQAKINALKGKRVEVAAYLRKAGSWTLSANVRISNGYLGGITKADGGIVRAMAAGGIDGANIYSRSDGVMYNEPETMGEAYIPLANDWRRPRAVAVWRETGRLIGAMAAGGVYPSRLGGTSGIGSAGGGSTQVINLNATVARGVDPLSFAREVEAALTKLKQQNRRLAFQGV